MEWLALSVASTAGAMLWIVWTRERGERVSQGRLLVAGTIIGATLGTVATQILDLQTPLPRLLEGWILSLGTVIVFGSASYAHSVSPWMTASWLAPATIAIALGRLAGEPADPYVTIAVSLLVLLLFVSERIQILWFRRLWLPVLGKVRARLQPQR